jgi:hypothetical protein
MLLLPFLAAITATAVRWLHLPLLAAWMAGYLSSYYACKRSRPAGCAGSVSSTANRGWPWSTQTAGSTA